MRIDCISNIGEAGALDFAGKTALVIDTLRATSTIAAALASGAEAIIPVETVAQAKQLAGEHELLAGERRCKKIPGFHLGNSPLEYSPNAVKDKTIVMTTTNGTRGLRKCSTATTVIAASLLNASACAKAAWELGRDVVLLCSGTQDEFAHEDGLCAGLLAQEIRSLANTAGTQVRMNDLAAAMADAYAYREGRLEEVLLSCDSGKRLIGLGLGDDVLYCSQVNILNIVPVMNGDKLRKLEAVGAARRRSKSSHHS